MSEVPQQLKNKITAEVQRLKGIAEKRFGRTLDMPTIRYDLRGTTAGMAHGTHLIRLNADLLLENQESFLKDTVPHEFAHNVDCATSNRDQVGLRMDRRGRIRRAKRSVHGPSWKAIMYLFGADPERTHNYDTSRSQVRVKGKFEYRCTNCDRRIVVSSVVHNRIQRGRQYWHKGASCGQGRGALEFVRALGQQTYGQLRSAAEVPAPRPTKEVPVQSLLKPVKEPRGGIAIAQGIMAKYGHDLTRQQFIVRAVEAGLKATTASTYYAKLRRKP